MSSAKWRAPPSEKTAIVERERIAGTMENNNMNRRNTRANQGRRICVCTALLCLLFFAASSAFGFTLTLAWDKNPESNILGYYLDYGLTSCSGSTTCSYPHRVEIPPNAVCSGEPNAICHHFPDGVLQDGMTHYFAVKAYNSYGVSGYSNELPYTPPTSNTNQAPVAKNGSLSVLEDSTGSGALSATDPDGNPLTFSIVSPPSIGTVSLDASTGTFTYAPNPNANGSDFFTFTARDSALTSNTATFSINISPVNDPPVAVPDSAQTVQNQPVTISVLANDTDVDGDSLSLASTTHGGHGVTERVGNTAKYSPNTDFTGSDSFSYTVMDGKGAYASGPVTVTVAPAGGGSDPVILPQAGWTLRYVDSEELFGENGAAVNAFDNDPGTFWHTEWSLRTPAYPHEIQINLGGVYEVQGFRYLPRQDSSANGRIRKYEFYVSSDGVAWGSPVVAGEFGNDTNEKQVSFGTRSGSFIRLKAISEVNGNPWTSMAEIRLLGKALQSSSLLPRAGWILKYVDSQELVGEDGAAKNCFDDSRSTIWHTQWSSGSPKHPHEIQIELGGVYEIDGFRYLPRQDGSANGRVKGYELYISPDGVQWGTPVVTGVFANDSAEKRVSFEPRVGGFVRMRALSEVNGNPWTSMADFQLLGR